MCPFQNGSSTSGILNKLTVSAKFTCDDLCGESESYIEIELCDDISPVLSVETLCLVGKLWIVLSVPRTWLIV